MAPANGIQKTMDTINNDARFTAVLWIFSAKFIKPAGLAAEVFPGSHLNCLPRCHNDIITRDQH